MDSIYHSIKQATVKEFPFHHRMSLSAWVRNDFYFRSLNCFENASDDVTSQRKVCFLLWNVHQSGKYHLTEVNNPNEKPQLLKREQHAKASSQWTFCFTFWNLKPMHWTSRRIAIELAKNILRNKVQTKSFMTWRNDETKRWKSLSNHSTDVQVKY